MNENDEDATTYEKKVLVFIKTALLSDNLSTFIKEAYERKDYGFGERCLCFLHFFGFYRGGEKELIDESNSRVSQ